MLRCRLYRLSPIDRITGEPLRRYEHPHPGAMPHVDVTKDGNIPDRGGRFQQRGVTVEGWAIARHHNSE